MHRALAARLTRVAAQLSEGLSDEDLERALSVATDLEALIVALQRSPLQAEPLDPEVAAAYARGRSARAGLLAAEGGVASSEEMRELLGGITRQAVDKRRQGGGLLAVRERSDWFYPRWQVINNGETLPGLKPVLEALSANGHDGWGQLIFFLSTETARDGETPLAALRAGRTEAALVAARMYGEQGAR
jgi:hypothetical protein